MEEPSYCNLSLAVDCTLSLGSTTTTSRAEIPARLSRAGSPDQADLAWSLAVRSDQRADPARGARTCEPDRSNEQAMSWGGSCDRSDPGAALEYFPQVEGRVLSDVVGGQVRDDLKASAWPSSTTSGSHRRAATYKADARVGSISSKPAQLFSVIKSTTTQSYSNRASTRVQAPWLTSSSYNNVNIPDSNTAVAAATAAGASSQCIQVDAGENSSSFARVCAHCNTSKTPLWRNGPSGPKSLCNACGIRFKKAGRRSAANGNGSGSEAQLSPPTSPTTSKPSSSKRIKLGSAEDVDYWVFPPDHVAKPRKRSRAPMNMSGSCVTWQSTLPDRVDRPSGALQGERKKKARRRIHQPPSFSSDEEEGAVLLMALSCGMVNA